MRSVVGLALLLGAASGFQAVAPALRPLASAATPICRTAVAPTMRHNLYFQRLARADAGRLRLCVYRRVPAPARDATAMRAPRAAAMPLLRRSLAHPAAPSQVEQPHLRAGRR